jgi:hypothetical protein
MSRSKAYCSLPPLTVIPVMKKVKVALEQAMKAQRGSGGITLLFFKPGH